MLFPFQRADPLTINSVARPEQREWLGRSLGDLRLEAAVHALTGRQAELLGLGGRDIIAPGMAADVIVFALDELVYAQERLANDLPGGLSRLTRDPGGYRFTIVNGEIVQANGRATGALPARLLARAA